MSAAANAAGYLHAHGLLPMSEREPRVNAAGSHQADKQTQRVKEARTPRIEYRKRRIFSLPSAE